MTTHRTISTVAPYSEHVQRLVDEWQTERLYRDLVDAAKKLAQRENAAKLSVSFTVELTAGNPVATVICEVDAEPRTVPRLVFRGGVE